MPQLIIPALAAIIGTVAATIVANVLVTVLISIALTKIESLFANKPGAAPPPPINVTGQATVEFRRIVLGKIRCGGVVAFYSCAGSTNQFLFYVIMYAGHQCHAALDAFLDARQVPAADINATTGAVATTTFNGALRIWTHLGTDGQAVDPQLNSFFPTIFDSSHKLRGVCYRVFQLTRDDKGWPNGIPANFNSIVQGALVYDPRKDSTNLGSGTHTRTDPSTWEYSDNAALCIRWYVSGGSVTNDTTTRKIVYGLKEIDSRIDDAYVIAAANHSDESLSGANAPPSGAQARYVIGIECSSGQTRRDILVELLATLGTGQLSYVHGTWRLYAGAYDAPANSFTQDDLYGEMEISDTSSATDRFNTVCAAYVDSSQLWQAATTIYRTNSAYVTQDAGEVIQKTVTTRGVTDNYRAQRIAEQVMRASRLMRTVKFRFKRGGMRVATWETFSFSHKRYGWSGRIFRCIERGLEYQTDGGVLAVITGKFEDPGVYTDLLTADYKTGTSILSAIQSEVPDAATSLTITSIGGQNIRLDWTLAPFWEANGVSEIYEGTAITPFSSATFVWRGRGTNAILTRDDTVTRYYWVVVRNAAGNFSAPFPATSGVAGAASQVATGDVASNAASQVVAISSASSQTLTLFADGVSGGMVVLAASITATGSPTSIDVSADVDISVADPTNFTVGTVMVMRDGSGTAASGTQLVGTFDLLAAWKAPANGNVALRALVMLNVNDTPAAGSHTYWFIIATATNNVGGHPLVGGVTVSNCTQKVREYKL